MAGESTKPYVFSGIDRSEYAHLYSFLSTKKLRIKNIKQTGNDPSLLHLADEEEHDPYRAALDEDQVRLQTLLPQARPCVALFLLASSAGSFFG